MNIVTCLLVRNTNSIFSKCRERCYPSERLCQHINTLRWCRWAERGTREAQERGGDHFSGEPGTLYGHRLAHCIGTGGHRHRHTALADRWHGWERDLNTQAVWGWEASEDFWERVCFWMNNWTYCWTWRRKRLTLSIKISSEKIDQGVLVTTWGFTSPAYLIEVEVGGILGCEFGRWWRKLPCRFCGELKEQTHSKWLLVEFRVLAFWGSICCANIQ